MTTAFQADAFQVSGFQIAVDAVAPGDVIERRQRTLIAGVATGTEAGDTVAQGALLEVAISLLAGTATGSIPVAVITGGRRGWFEPREDAIAYGDTLRVRVRLIVGQASTLSLLAGKAAGDAVADGTLLEVAAQILSGTAAGELNYADDELLMIFAEAA